MDCVRLLDLEEPNERFVDKKRIYSGVDLMKLLFAISIVFMHTYCHDLGIIGSTIVKFVSVTGVPFFFICSGFFLKIGLDRYQSDDEKRAYYNNYIIRLLKMYVSWSLITLPVAVIIITRAYPDSSVFFKFIYWIRMFLLSGSLGVYWYILALMISSFFLYYSDKRGYTVFLFVFSFIFFVWGELYNSSINKGQLYFEWIHVLFSSSRNFLNTGLFYMIIGYTIARMINYFVKNRSLVLFLLVFSLGFRICEVYMFETSIGVVFLSISSFIAAISVNAESVNTLLFRKLSIGLYMIHFPFILLFDFYLKKGTMIDFPISLTFSLVLFIIIAKVLPKNIFHILFG